jgi:hypothetical protein
MWRLSLIPIVLQSPRAHAFDDAVRSQDHRLRHLGIAHAQEHHVGIGGDLFGRRAKAALLFIGEFAGFVAGVGPDRYLVSSPQKIPRHGIAHEPQSKKSEFCHRKRIVPRG